MKLFRTPIGYAHWCAGCRGMHEFNTDKAIPNARWTFDGNLQAPTFVASMRSFTPARKPDPADPQDKGRPERTECHYHLTKGVIKYLNDSAGHALRGKHPLEHVPETYGIPDSWKGVA